MKNVTQSELGLPFIQNVDPLQFLDLLTLKTNISIMIVKHKQKWILLMIISCYHENILYLCLKCYTSEHKALYLLKYDMIMCKNGATIFFFIFNDNYTCEICSAVTWPPQFVCYSSVGNIYINTVEPFDHIMVLKYMVYYMHTSSDIGLIENVFLNLTSQKKLECVCNRSNAFIRNSLFGLLISKRIAGNYHTERYSPLGTLNLPPKKSKKRSVTGLASRRTQVNDSGPWYTVSSERQECEKVIDADHWCYVSSKRQGRQTVKYYPISSGYQSTHADMYNNVFDILFCVILITMLWSILLRILNSPPNMSKKRSVTGLASRHTQVNDSGPWYIVSSDRQECQKVIDADHWCYVSSKRQGRQTVRYYPISFCYKSTHADMYNDVSDILFCPITMLLSTLLRILNLLPKKSKKRKVASLMSQLYQVNDSGPWYIVSSEQQECQKVNDTDHWCFVSSERQVRQSLKGYHLSFGHISKHADMYNDVPNILFWLKVISMLLSILLITVKVPYKKVITKNVLVYSLTSRHWQVIDLGPWFYVLLIIQVTCLKSQHWQVTDSGLQFNVSSKRPERQHIQRFNYQLSDVGLCDDLLYFSCLYSYIVIFKLYCHK